MVNHLKKAIYQGNYPEVNFTPFSALGSLQRDQRKSFFAPEIDLATHREKLLTALTHGSRFSKKTLRRPRKRYAPVGENAPFDMKASHRVIIPKPGKDGKRPLTVASPRVKIIQEAIRMVLDLIYEPILSDISHRFRHGLPRALRNIKTHFYIPSWWIDFGIRKCFNTINIHTLHSIMKETIQDRRLTGLRQSKVQAKVFHVELPL